jgi:hypothetical protein
MDIWVKDITTIKESSSPIEEALTIIFKSIAKDNWKEDPLIKKIIASTEFNSNNTFQNQFKTACVMYSCFYLLKHEIQKGFEQHLVALIFASLFHNFKHKGGMNKYVFENEKHAIEQMYEFATASDFIKLWGKHPWMSLKNMPSWVNLTDALEEIILVSDFSDTKNIGTNYVRSPEALWRADLPLQINRLKQIFLEALLLCNVMEPFLFEENKKMLEENGAKFKSDALKRQIKTFLQNFALNVYISRASIKLDIQETIQHNTVRL